ncbi:MAG: Rv1355c family protein [Mycobacteriales bacterium]
MEAAPAAYGVEILDPAEPADLARITELRTAPTLEVVDHAADQRRELETVRPAPSAELLNEPMRWVHYPWRRALVSVVGPRSYRTLRLDRNRNKITGAEQQRFSEMTIGVVGLSVGHAIAHTIALEGLCGALRLADFDCVELSNLNRIPGTVFDLEVNKATVAARRIAELDPYLSVTVFPAGVTEDDVDQFLFGLDIVIEECDSLDVKVLVRDRARGLRIPVMMETSDRGLIDVERFDLEPDRPLFHGLAGDLDHATLRGLTNQQKVPHVLRIVDAAGLSPRMAASMVEIDETLTTWPQLGSDVALGGATVATIVRRIGRGEPMPSGRLHVDLDARLDDLVQPPLRQGTHAEDGEELHHAPAEPHAAVVHAARLAPSGGNVQPWWFEDDPDEFRIALAADRTSAMDVAFRGSYVAIGAALLNARVAAARHGVLGPAAIPAHDHGYVATMRYATGSDDDLAGLYDAMLARSANRRPGDGRPLDRSVEPALRAAAEAETGRLHLITDRAVIEQCAELLGRSDRIRFLTPLLHGQMMSELRVPGVDSLSTGLDVRTMELDEADLAKLEIARRADAMARLAEWNAGSALGYPTRDRVRSSSALAVVTVAGASPADFVRGGSAVERLWITAETLGLAVQPVSPVFIFALDRSDAARMSGQFVDEMEQLRNTFRSAAGLPDDEYMALVLRLGHAPPPGFRSRRLPADQVVRSGSAAGLS